MPARPRQTAHVCGLIEFTEDSAVRAHRLILLAWTDDGRIDDDEVREILAATSEVVERAGTSVSVMAAVDHTIATGLSLIHNGYSPRSQRLISEMNVVEVDFRGSDPDGTDDDGAALRAA